MFTVATPLAMAQYSEEMYDEKDQTNKKMHKVIEVDGFIGSIQITHDADKQTLKDQITVSLSDAASGLDVTSGGIGVAVNENDDKYFVWILKSFEKDSESGVTTVTTYVIDVADVTNTTTVTKDIEQPQKAVKNSNQISKKIDRLEEKISKSSGNVDFDDLRTTFLEKFQELRKAMQDGDSDRVSELREELKDIRSELGKMRTK